MKSWLNWYAILLADDFCRHEAERGRQCDYDVGRIFFAFTAEGIRFMKKPGAAYDDTLHGERFWFLERIAPFAGHFSEKPALAAQLEPHAVFDFRDAGVDENVRSYAQQVLARHSIVHLDIPDRTYLLRGGVFQLRALFIWQCREGNRFCAILTRPGSNRGWRMAWLEGRHARYARDSAFDDVWAMSSLDMRDRCRPINFNRIDYSQFAEVEKLAWASLACWQDAIDANGVQVEEILQMPLNMREQPLDLDIEPPVMGELFSLFKMVRIRNVNPARIRVIGERVSAVGHTKCRHEVKEFWRWQACGKERKERRWTKVTGHMRGRETPRAPMHVIRSPAVV